MSRKSWALALSLKVDSDLDFNSVLTCRQLGLNYSAGVITAQKVKDPELHCLLTSQPRELYKL